MKTELGRQWLLPVLCTMLTMPMLASSCVVAGHGVVTAVESHYVANRKDVLSVSGRTANHPLYGTFTVDDPPVLNKTYEGEDDATLTFTHDGTVLIATITSKGDKPVKYVFLDHGAPNQARIFGLYWTLDNPAPTK